MIGRIAALAGAIPTQIEVPDLATAFATGRVDVMITSAATGVDTKAGTSSRTTTTRRPGCRATSCS
jgi:TRAP-type C4-dicarboxylate transport system substrate-binding protein